MSVVVVVQGCWCRGYSAVVLEKATGRLDACTHGRYVQLRRRRVLAFVVQIDDGG